MCPLLLQILVPQMSKSFLCKVLLDIRSLFDRPVYQVCSMLQYSKLSWLSLLTLLTRMWLKRLMLSCVLLLLAVPFSWSSCLVLYQIPYVIWSVGIPVVGIICYPLILWTQVMHFSFPLVWHLTIMCLHFLCLSKWFLWPFVEWAGHTCAYFANIFWMSWLFYCLFSWLLSLSTMQMLVNLWFGWVLCTLLVPREGLLDVLNLISSRTPIFPLYANFPSFGGISPPLFSIVHMVKEVFLPDMCAIGTQIYDGVE